MTSTYRGPTGKRVSLVAAAQSPGNLDPGRGSTSTATSSTAKDAGTSSMPPPSVPSSALSKAGPAGSAASSQRDLQLPRLVELRRCRDRQSDPPVTVP